MEVDLEQLLFYGLAGGSILSIELAVHRADDLRPDVRAGLAVGALLGTLASAAWFASRWVTEGDTTGLWFPTLLFAVGALGLGRPWLPVGVPRGIEGRFARTTRDPRHHPDGYVPTGLGLLILLGAAAAALLWAGHAGLW